MKLFLLILVFAFLQKDKIIEVSSTHIPIHINGKIDLKEWDESSWYPIQETWIGITPMEQDFQGRYKLQWDENFLYLLAEIIDDTLVDTHPDPYIQYWDDDCLEIFIDEDRSKGDHLYSHQAFAYHIGLNNQVVDYGPDQRAHDYSSHIKCQRITKGKKSTWECAIRIFDSSFNESSVNKPLKLKENKKMGFALAYCDNDGSLERENFIGSVFVPGIDKNQGYKDAGIFGEIRLKTKSGLGY